jgi:hypothetical protein
MIKLKVLQIFKNVQLFQIFHQDGFGVHLFCSLGDVIVNFHLLEKGLFDNDCTDNQYPYDEKKGKSKEWYHKWHDLFNSMNSDVSPECFNIY